MAHDNDWEEHVQNLYGEQAESHYKFIGASEQFVANRDRFDPGPASSTDALLWLRSPHGYNKKECDY